MSRLSVGRTDNTILFPKTELEIIIIIIQSFQSVWAVLVFFFLFFCLFFYSSTDCT